MAQDIRPLSASERDVRARLKRKVIAMAIVERARKKQCARIAFIKEGDANTKNFHLRVNGRRRKNHIHRLKQNHGWVTDHAAKEEVVLSHFQSVIGRGEERRMDLNWGDLHFDNSELAALGAAFTEEEVQNAINQLPGDKAPGPDGFTTAFFKKCWDIIKVDTMAVVEKFGNL
jgi:hypothetical protein